MSSSLVFAGADGEMSSGTQYAMENRKVYDGRGRLIQWAVSFDRNTCIKVDIGWPSDDMDWSPEAAAVHQLSFNDVTEKFPSAYEADKILCEAIRELYPDKDRRFIVPIGWNVASFDMPFVRFALPDFFDLTSRRTVDLNAVVYSMDGIYDVSGSKKVGYTTLKKQSKTYARWKLAEVGVPYRPHDAGWDAQMSLLCWDYLRLVMAGEAPNLSNVKLE